MPAPIQDYLQISWFGASVSVEAINSTSGYSFFIL